MRYADLRERIIANSVVAGQGEGNVCNGSQASNMRQCVRDGRHNSQQQAAH